jgi:outer membrane cobalamin receptor
MKTFFLNAHLLAAVTLTLSLGVFPLKAAQVQGVVVDPAGLPIAGAQVAAFNPTGVIFEQITDDRGGYDFNVSPLYENVQLRVTATGFQTVTTGETTAAVHLLLAPQSDSVRVTGSVIDVPASQQGSSVSVIGSAEIRARNEGQIVDLMRQLPGMVFSQNGGRGSLADLFVRGGDPKYNLVLFNGIPVNSFYQGGLVDFSQIPSDAISEIDVARGPQSALYGSYAIGSVVNIVARSPENGPALDLIAEGGTHDENRFSGSGSVLAHGWGIAGSFSSLLTNGPVINSDYRNHNAYLALEHRWRTQNLFVFGDFGANDVGEPGAYGSNPKGFFSGLDTLSRSRNNTSTAGVHYQDGFTPNLRLDVTAGFFLNNSYFVSPFVDSYNKDLRPYGDARGTWHLLSFWTLAGGFSFDREEMKNTFVATTNGYNFPFRRDNEGVYLDNEFSFRNKLFVNAGVREEIYQTGFVPGQVSFFSTRPDFPARNDSRLNPKISGAYIVRTGLRIHASFGTGIRPPGGSDIAFTNNPGLKPERTLSYDFGAEQRFWSDRLSLGATYFNNRYKDLIVSLGGSLSKLSFFSTDNVSNALAKGVELNARVRPNSWLSVTGNYTWLQTEVLSLNGGNGLVQQFYYLGQPLFRRPKHSGSTVVTARYKRIDGNFVAEARGRALDIEPTLGASGGVFWNAGFFDAGININYRIRGHLTAYANLRNAFDRRYEEIYGFPAPLLNVVAGIKWSLARAR